MELAQLSSGAVAHTIEAPVTQRATPEALFERWERQRWSTAQIDLATDRDAWHEQTSTYFRDLMASKIKSLVIGEYTAVDHVSIVSVGAPDEGYLTYLATQSADEAQHWRFVTRLAAEIMDGEGEPGPRLADAWREATPGMRALVLHEADVARQLARDPHNYELWLQLVTIFHLITEGVLATTGQRTILRLLAKRDLFPGMQAGFSALARDEGRHVAFGLHALRQGIAEGCGDAIWDAVERIAPVTVTVDVVPGSGGFERSLAQRSGRELIKTLESRLRSIGADQRFVSHVNDCGMAALAVALAQSEDTGPVR